MATRVAGKHRSGPRFTEKLDVRKMIFTRVCEETNPKDRICLNADKYHPSNHRLTVRQMFLKTFS